MKKITLTLLIISSFSVNAARECKYDPLQYNFSATINETTLNERITVRWSGITFPPLFCNAGESDCIHDGYRYEGGIYKTSLPAGIGSVRYIHEVCREDISSPPPPPPEPTCPSGFTLEGSDCVHRVLPTVVDNRTFYWSCSGSSASHTNVAGSSVSCSTGTGTPPSPPTEPEPIEPICYPQYDPLTGIWTVCI